jgi:hypothetical protein
MDAMGLEGRTGTESNGELMYNIFLFSTVGIIPNAIVFLFSFIKKEKHKTKCHMCHSILFDYDDWLYVGLFCCDWNVGWGQVPCPKGKEKQVGTTNLSPCPSVDSWKKRRETFFFIYSLLK